MKGTRIREKLTPHPRIVQSLERGYRGLVPYEIIEYVPGQNLRRLVQDRAPVIREQSFEVLYLDGNSALFLRAGLISIGYFATAWLGHSLASRAVAIEAIVAQREVDLASMAQINKLIIQDMQDGVIVADERGVIRQPVETC